MLHKRQKFDLRPWKSGFSAFIDGRYLGSADVVGDVVTITCPASSIEVHKDAPQESANPEINFLGDLQRIEVKPGDRFVLSTDKALSMEVAQFLRERLSEQLGGAPVIVLSGGFKLGVMGEGEN